MTEADYAFEKPDEPEKKKNPTGMRNDP